MSLYKSPPVSAKYIADRMKHVQVNEAAVERLAKLVCNLYRFIINSLLYSFSSIKLFDKISSSEYDIGRWKTDNALHPQQANEHSVDWIFVVDSLNFSFWPDVGSEFTIEGQIGYWALCAAINRALKENIPITDANFYSKLSFEEACHIFRTDQEGIDIPMMKERLQVLHENGKTLVEVKKCCQSCRTCPYFFHSTELWWLICELRCQGQLECTQPARDYLRAFSFFPGREHV